MTVNDGKNLLFDFFSQNDFLDLNEDFAKVVLISLDTSIDKEILKISLKELEASGIVNPINLPQSEHGNTWVLNKPISQYSQHIELKHNTISEIAKTINSFCDKIENHENRVDVLNIVERDIQNLIVLAQTSLKDEG